MPSCHFRECLAGKAFPRDSRETFFLELFKCDFSTLHLYYIYPHYPQMYVRPFREKNPRQVFYNTHTPIFQRESYSSLVRIHCSLFSFPLPLSYLERRFVPKHNPHLFRVQWVFLELLGNIGRSQGWQMQHGACCEIQRAGQDTIPRSLVGVGAWRAQVHRVNQA